MQKKSPAVGANNEKNTPMRESDASIDTIKAKSKKGSSKKAFKSKTLDTYLKNQSRLLMSSISIADKKASILIRLNTALVSSLIVFESYFNVNLSLNQYFVPVLIIGLSISLLFAILVAKPFSYKLYAVLNKVVKSSYPKLEENNFFLIDDVSFSDYEASMEKVVESQDLQIGNLTRFNFFMSKSISQKFVLLEIAYTIFFLTLFSVLVLYLFSKFA
ncbi:hypothetical protein [Lewinella sp. 4G2]|uniref:hypothetical protein n=1 Tax=Lewinella sp. 4G2 TaxID=1803372 RepID=UPI0007B4DAD2|nr:hypothetical protein [Lewinella sp. 4G2]OAV45141.1 hypothetical protein A3850_011855 [Lewinella sp. 4G2]